MIGGAGRFRRVGILGGMGPLATVMLMQRLIAAVAATDDGDHIPLIVDQNPQVPSRLRRLIDGTGDDPAPVLAAMAARLQGAGAEALAMPCNTAHQYALQIRNAAHVPFLDMIEHSASHALALTGKGARVGILGSPALRQIKVFEPVFAEAGLVPVYPKDEAELRTMIQRIKTGGACDISHAGLRVASADLLAQGVDVQMIACTEFSLLGPADLPERQAFDTLDCLVRAIVEFSTGEQPTYSPAMRSSNRQDFARIGPRT